MRRLTLHPSLLLLSLPATKYIPGVSQFCLKEWQDIWNCCECNKLHAIYPNVGRIPHCKNLSRRDAVVINILRIVAGQINANMQHNRANGDTSTKIGVMTP